MKAPFLGVRKFSIEIFESRLILRAFIIETLCFQVNSLIDFFRMKIASGSLLSTTFYFGEKLPKKWVDIYFENDLRKFAFYCENALLKILEKNGSFNFLNGSFKFFV